MRRRGATYQSRLMSRRSLLLDLHVCAGRSEGVAASHASFGSLLLGAQWWCECGRIARRDIRGGWRLVRTQAAIAFLPAAQKSSQVAVAFVEQKAGW